MVIHITFPVLEDIAASLRSIATTLKHLKKPPIPGRLIIHATKEENDMLTFKVQLPALAAGSDVVSRELSVAVAGAEANVQTVPADQAEVEGFSGQQGDSVEMSLVDIDDAGNRSEPRNESATLTDTIAPPQPGEFGLLVTGES